MLVMAFIGWGWRDSTVYYTEIEKGRYDLLSRDSMLWIVNSNDDVVELDVDRDRLDRLTPRSETPLFPPPRFLRGFGEPRPDTPQVPRADATIIDELDQNARFQPLGTWILILPYWMILMLFACVWCALLAWRAERRKWKQKRLEATPEGDSPPNPP